MRIAQDTDKLLCPHRDGSSASGKDSTQKKSTVADVLSRAVEVYISAKGKSLNESTDMEDDLTPAELALAADEKERADKKAKKAQAAEIEKRIQTDATLTDEDKLSELHDKVDALEKLVADGLVSDDEIDRSRRLYKNRISQLKSEMKDKDHHTMKLRGQALQERADRDVELTKAQEKERAALAAAQPDDRTARTALRAYQKTAAAKKHTDLSAIVVPTNKNTSDT